MLEEKLITFAVEHRWKNILEAVLEPHTLSEMKSIAGREITPIELGSMRTLDLIDLIIPEEGGFKYKISTLGLELLNYLK